MERTGRYQPTDKRYVFMEGGQATARQLVEVPAIQKPAEPLPGKLFDSHGDTVRPEAKSLMVRIDAKASEKVELSKGTLAAIAVIPALLLVLFNYGAGAIGWVRSDETRRVEIQSLQKDLDTVKDDLKTIKETIQAKAIKDAEARGYQLKAAEGEHK